MPTLTLLVRPERADDAPLVRALHLEALAETLGPDVAALLIDQQLRAREAQRAVARPDAVAQVAEVDGRPVGRLVVDASGAVLRVVDLGVLAAVRRRGVASALLRPWLDRADAEGRDVGLLVAHGNPARLLYEALGFAVAESGPTDLLMHRPPEGVHRDARR